MPQLGRPKVKMVKRICKVCDKEFEIYPSRAKIKGVIRYCSIKCHAIARRKF